MMWATESAGQDSGRFARWVWDDAVGMVQNTLPFTPAVFVAGGFVVPAARRFDEEVLESVQSGYSGTWKDYLDIANDLGSAYTWLPATSLFAISLATDNEKFQDAAFTSAEAVVAATAVTATIKFVMGRARPLQSEGPLHMRPFSGNESFPSGHTTIAFAVMTPWIVYYPGPVTYSLLILSASTGIARIAKDKHWPTDVLAGAAVGVLTGRYLARRHQRGSAVPSTTVQPVVGPGEVGLTVRVRM